MKTQLAAIALLAIISSSCQYHKTGNRTDTTDKTTVNTTGAPTPTDDLPKSALPNAKVIRSEEVVITKTMITGDCTTPLSPPASAVPHTVYDGKRGSSIESYSWSAAKSKSSAKCAEMIVTEARAMAGESYNSGLLTAGEIHDFSKWKMWNDIAEHNLKEYMALWKTVPLNRYMVQVVNSDRGAAADVPIELRSSDGSVVWRARTDNTGKAELWDGFFGSKETQSAEIVAITPKGETKLKRLRKFEKGVNQIQLKLPCNQPDAVDIVFTVDATGSMGDEIEYLKAELNDIISKAKARHKDLKFNMGSVFYRDHGDEYVVRTSPITPDISKTISFIKNQRADGGGDTPEALDEALQESLKLKWSNNARARLMFVVLDAPPHHDDAVMKRLHESISVAAAMGIRIIPLTASGIDKNTEYLMRSIALATNGTYTFLTDHSGIGNPHLEPTTDKYDVELLNDLLLRLIDQFTYMPACKVEVTPNTTADTVSLVINSDGLNNALQSTTGSDSASATPFDQNLWIKCYPNPTRGPLHVEYSEQVTEFYLADLNGKLLERFDSQGTNRMVIDLSQYPTGTYCISYPSGKRNVTAKVALVR